MADFDYDDDDDGYTTSLDVVVHVDVFVIVQYHWKSKILLLYVPSSCVIVRSKVLPFVGDGDDVDVNDRATPLLSQLTSFLLAAVLGVVKVVVEDNSSTSNMARFNQ